MQTDDISILLSISPSNGTAFYISNHTPFRFSLTSSIFFSLLQPLSISIISSNSITHLNTYKHTLLPSHCPSFASTIPKPFPQSLIQAFSYSHLCAFPPTELSPFPSAISFALSPTKQRAIAITIQRPKSKTNKLALFHPNNDTITCSITPSYIYTKRKTHSSSRFPYGAPHTAPTHSLALTTALPASITYTIIRSFALAEPRSHPNSLFASQLSTNTLAFSDSNGLAIACSDLDTHCNWH
jgi:hypothetical protein